MIMKKIIYSAILLGILTACENAPIEAVQIIPLPTEMESGMPRLFTNKEGQTFLSWIEKDSTQSAKLLYTKINDGKWDEPKLIAEGNNWFLNWADFPSIIENEGEVTAHWLQKSDVGTFDYDVRVAMTANKGQVWQNSFVPHKDGIAAEHGFVSMLPLKNQRTFITWLDGRNTKVEGESSGHSGGHGGGPMSLRAGIFDQNGNTIQEWELDNRVCDCCQTAAVETAEGITVFYRDRSENEIRDISVVRLKNNEWTEPTPLMVELWEMPACPVNGPSASAQGDHLAVAWFMAKGGTPEVKLAFSEDGGASFGDPIMVSQGNTIGRVGTAMLNDGTALVSWMESQGDTAQIMLARYDKSGALLDKKMIAQNSAARASGFPVLTSNGEDVYMAWTEAQISGQIKTAKINF